MKPHISTTEPTSPTVRTRVRRVAHRGHYDRTTLHATLDKAYVCHIAFAGEHDVHCVPAACWREGGHLYTHGSNSSHVLRLAGNGAQVCVTITHLDGLMLARSTFNHSVSYRSAVIYGASEVVPGAQKSAVLDTFMEVLAPGRSQQARPGNAKGLAATTMLRIPPDETVCKMRMGGPKDDAEDLELLVWTGVLPMALLPLPPVVQATPAGTPDYVREWRDNARVPVGDVVVLRWLRGWRLVGFGLVLTVHPLSQPRQRMRQGIHQSPKNKAPQCTS